MHRSVTDRSACRRGPATRSAVGRAAVGIAVLSVGVADAVSPAVAAPRVPAPPVVASEVTINVGANVQAVAVDPTLHLAYFVREQPVRGKEFPAAVLVEVNVKTHRIVRRLVVGHDTVSGAAVDTRTHRIYVLLGGHNNGDIGPEGIQVVSGPKGRVIAHLNPGSGAVGMAVAPGRRQGWVATIRDGVGIVNLRTSKRVGRYASAASPEAIARDPATGHVISVANVDTRRVATIATPAGHVVASVVVGTGTAYPFTPNTVALDPGRHAAFFANADSGQVRQLDTRTHHVIRRFATDSSGVGAMSVDPRAGLLLVIGNPYAASPEKAVAAFDEETGHVDFRVFVGGTPTLLANDPVDAIEVVLTTDGRVHLLDLPD